MNSIDPPSWQTVLDLLTKKAEEWKFLKGLSGKSETEIVQKCLQHEALQSYLLDWMDLCLKSAPKKCFSTSKSLRVKGNEEFKKRHETVSLSLYSDCIRFAPHASEEHAVGLANRSAVLFHMGKYNECLKDIERALSIPSYPSHLRHKLLLRQARCHLSLQNWNKCQETLKLAESCLSSYSSNDGDSKVEGARQEIKSLEMDLQEKSKKLNSQPQPVIEKQTKETLPCLLGGCHSELPSASAALELRHSEMKGRYIITKQDVNPGDVLFVEKPYAFVVLPEQFKVHCHHCTRLLVTPIPCEACTDVLFCDETCKINACEGYHRWECGGISLMSAVGVAHLGLRIILTTGGLSEVLERSHAASQYAIVNERGSGSGHGDPYTAVFSLLPHISDMPPGDIFQYSATALLLSLFLIQKTEYFKTNLSSSIKKDVVAKICALLFRHIAQLVCNAHAITKLDSDRKKDDLPVNSVNTVVSESQQRIATAIYPSASMMNHSCNPNIINSFCNEVLIVKASRRILKGEEVFNCYGPHFQRMGTAERQAALQAQYFFHCNCTACTTNPGESFDPVQERLYALKCTSCSGPLLNEAPGREPAGSKVPQSDTANSHFMVCDSCGLQQPISSLVRDAFCALSLFKQGCEDMEGGHMQDAMNNLNQCRELQERALYCRNKDLTATYDMLAKCYATFGRYGESAQLLERMLPAIEEQYGANSIEVAHELQKLSDVILCHLRTMETTPPKDKLINASKVVERALSILSTHYGKWNQGWQDLERKLHEIRLMEDMAKVQGNFEDKVRM